jgi:Predicted integral membrane protein (DUF2269)
VSTTYNFWVFLHIAGVLGFLAGHGVGWVASARLRSERNPERLRTLLDLTDVSFRLADAFLGLLLLGGIVAGFQGSWWSQGWIGLALFLVVAVTAVRSILLPRHLRAVRAALDGGQAGASLDGLLASGRPMLINGAEIVVVVIILYLMVYKPF